MCLYLFIYLFDLIWFELSWVELSLCFCFSSLNKSTYFLFIISFTALQYNFIQYNLYLLILNNSWRLAPSVTETRDGYLTKTMNRIEKLHNDNDNLPIILCCHSMVRNTHTHTHIYIYIRKRIIRLMPSHAVSYHLAYSIPNTTIQ